MILEHVNDFVKVELTAEGASTLNNKNRALNAMMPKQKEPRKTDYKEGDEYVDQFWLLATDFSEYWRWGRGAPFRNMRMHRKA